MSRSFDPLVGFRSEKAAQISAYFADAWGGKIDKLALIKLVYIAERESVRLRSRPMIYDECYSLKDGPICSSALDGINGHIDAALWNQYIHRNGDKDIYSVVDRPEYDQLSDSDVDILKAVVEEHKGKTGSQLRQWTHIPENVPEYTEVNGKDRLPINYAEIARGVRLKHPDDISEIERNHRRLARVFPGPR